MTSHTSMVFKGFYLGDENTKTGLGIFSGEVKACRHTFTYLVNNRSYCQWRLTLIRSITEINLLVLVTLTYTYDTARVPMTIQLTKSVGKIWVRFFWH